MEGAAPEDCLTLSRLWLSEELPRNSESRFIGLILRHLRRHTDLKFIVTYADPVMGHLGTIYQASNWVYTGLCQATPLYDLGDGKVYHSRSLAHVYGSHSVKHFAANGIAVEVVPQLPKHRYVYFLQPSWSSRLQVPVRPYPKQLHAIKEEI